MKKLVEKVETRSMPTLVEQRNNLLDEMEGLLSKTKAETRSFTDEESTRFDEIKKEIGKIDKTLAAEEESRSFEKKKVTGKEEQRALDEKNFLKFVKGEERALDVGQNGGIIPDHIANRIIDKVKELSPIVKMANTFYVGGNLVFPLYDEGTSSISAAYVEDMQELTEGTGKFTTVKLENFIIGSLAKISKSLMNRSDVDLLPFVINKVAEAIANFLEKEYLVGTTGKIGGLLGTATQEITAPSATALTADEFIDLQMEVPEVFQAGAIWIMNKKTFKAVRKLKNADGEYLLNKNVNNGFGWELLDKPVYVSESMPEIAASEKVVVYGDMTGLYAKLAQNVEIQVLVEKFATQHALGVVGYVEADAKVVEQQKIAVLKMAAV